MAEFEFGGEIVWWPTPEYVEGSHLQRFMQQHGIDSWHELYKRSIDDVAWFTEAMLTYLGCAKIRFAANAVPPTNVRSIMVRTAEISMALRLACFFIRVTSWLE